VEGWYVPVETLCGRPGSEDHARDRAALIKL
jgi:hypothetical protein